MLILAFNLAVEAQIYSPNPKILAAPEFYDIVIPRLEVYPKLLYNNLYYEGNNIIMRDLSGEPADSSEGFIISKNWRKLTENTKAAFVLRDALFSQQDHPYKFVPFALMLPANWITAAAECDEDSLKPVTAPPVYDDNSWSKIKTPEEMFGSFPGSETLFKLATKQPDRLPDTIYTYNARKTIRILAGYSKRLVEKRKTGIDAMIEEGADIIAGSDTLYFGEVNLRKHLIPIMVENPTQHEVFEGKGIALEFNDTVHTEIISAIRKILYKRRLADSDIALERYDLSNPGERKRAINVLQELIPENSKGNNIWLWVTGKLLKNKTLQGEDASSYISQFKKEIEKAGINTSRLRFVNKPYVKLPNKDGEKSLRESTERLHELGLYESVNLNGEQLEHIINSN